MEDSDAGKVFDEYGFVVEREGEGGDLDDTERCHVYRYSLHAREEGSVLEHRGNMLAWI